MCQDLLQLRLDLPPTSGKEDLSSSLIGEASRKVIAFLLKKGQIELAFPFIIVLSLSLFLSGNVSRLPSDGNI